jgi:membrane-bound lytic murein transglycosylase D
MFRLAGLGVGAATSPFRAPAAGAPPRPAGAPTAADPAVQPPGSQPAASQPTAAPAAQPTQPPATPVPPTPQPAATARPGQREHTVQSGDTLFALAGRYNTTVEALVAANNLRSRDATLAVGQKLIIPGP